MINLSKETIIAGVVLAVATAGLIAGDIAVSKFLLKRRVAALMEELKLTIKELHEEACKETSWPHKSEKAKIMILERLVAHDILNITNTLGPKVVVHLRQAVSDEIKKIVAN